MDLLHTTNMTTHCEIQNKKMEKSQNSVELFKIRNHSNLMLYFKYSRKTNSPTGQAVTASPVEGGQ